jgi:hypothetical protein
MYTGILPRRKFTQDPGRSKELMRFKRISDFLWSEVGVQENGMTITILSALARQERDPWETSRTLMLLPQREAVVKLSHLLASTPHNRLSLRETTDRARGLVASLQDQEASRMEAAPRRQHQKRGPAARPGLGQLTVPLRRLSSKRKWQLVRLSAFLVFAAIGLAMNLLDLRLSPTQTRPLTHAEAEGTAASRPGGVVTHLGTGDHV